MMHCDFNSTYQFARKTSTIWEGILFFSEQTSTFSYKKTHITTILGKHMPPTKVPMNDWEGVKFNLTLLVFTPKLYAVVQYIGIS